MLFIPGMQGYQWEFVHLQTGHDAERAEEGVTDRVFAQRTQILDFPRV